MPSAPPARTSLGSWSSCSRKPTSCSTARWPRQTTFSTIARELRKYYVTLLVVDQRPSQIYDEVMSQLGTRISGWLGDDDDIHAVLSGLAGREALRGMLARLQPKEEVLLLGWGVPMPLPVRSRRYDDAFWKELLGAKKGKGDGLKDLGFERCI